MEKDDNGNDISNLNANTDCKPTPAPAPPLPNTNTALLACPNLLHLWNINDKPSRFSNFKDGKRVN
jgi:hypothetical protein